MAGDGAMTGSMKRSATPRGADAIAERRARVAALLLGGASERAIAAALGLSNTTTHRDITSIRAEWLREQRTNAELAGAMQLARLDDMYAALWPRVRRGDTAACRATLGVMAREAKLLDLDASDRLDRDLYKRLSEIARNEGLDAGEILAEAEHLVRRRGDSPVVFTIDIDDGSNDDD